MFGVQRDQIGIPNADTTQRRNIGGPDVQRSEAVAKNSLSQAGIALCSKRSFGFGCCAVIVVLTGWMMHVLYTLRGISESGVGGIGIISRHQGE